MISDSEAMVDKRTGCVFAIEMTEYKKTAKDNNNICNGYKDRRHG